MNWLVLDIFLAMAACRFWCMRLQVAQKNAAEGRTGEDILQKPYGNAHDVTKPFTTSFRFRVGICEIKGV